MNSNPSSKIVGLFFCLFSVYGPGCRKYLEIEPPSVQLAAKSVFSSNATANAAQTAIYTAMNTNMESYHMSLYTGLLGDELTNYASGNSSLNELYINSMSSAGTSNDYGCWGNAYNYILQANSILEGITNNKAISPSIRNQLTGESKFIRAFWNFYLTNSFGNVPIALNTDYKVNAMLARSPQTVVYDQIIADLKDAASLLNLNFVDASDTTVTTDRGRPTKWAADALLARVYLYKGDYFNADSLSTVVINNNTLFGLVYDLDRVFLANSSEAIWQLAIPLPSLQNTPDGASYILQVSPGISGSVTISPQLMNSFETGDLRQQHWIGAYIDSSATPASVYNFPYKYKVWQTSTVDITEYVMVLRLAEQYLIRAEARVLEGNIAGPSGGVNDLNTVRNRAGLGNYSGANDQSSVLSAILQERQVELFTEWGHRWFDMIRTKAIDKVMGPPGNVCQFKGGTWITTGQLFPIPQSERKLDHNLTQNPGYN